MLKRIQLLADSIQKAQKIHVITHIDADGITAGAIALETIQRLGKTGSIECIKQLDDTVMARLVDENHELCWFTDLGSSIAGEYSDLPKIITDHHTSATTSDFPFHLNPHLFGMDGSYEISGAGVTYLVSKALNASNKDLSNLAVVGACGDLQHRKFRKLQGLNIDIVQDGISEKVLSTQIDISFFGRETRPVHKLLQYASDPSIPSISGREDTSLRFLKDLDIRIKQDTYWRKWVDLSKEEKRKIISAIALLFLEKGFNHITVKQLLSEVYELCNEETGTELHDAKEYATLLNSTARYGKHDVGLKVCLGDRGKWLKKAQNLLRGHRHNLLEGLQFAREEELHKKQYIQFFHAREAIRDTIIGIVTNMMLNSDDVDDSLPLIGFAYTENGDVKVSARTSQSVVNKGVDLSVALRRAAHQLDGVGGGHNIAAGATIPRGKEEEFLELLDKEIRLQLS